MAFQHHSLEKNFRVQAYHKSLIKEREKSRLPEIGHHFESRIHKDETLKQLRVKLESNEATEIDFDTYLQLIEVASTYAHERTLEDRIWFDAKRRQLLRIKKDGKPNSLSKEQSLEETKS